MTSAGSSGAACSRTKARVEGRGRGRCLSTVQSSSRCCSGSSARDVGRGPGSLALSPLNHGRLHAVQVALPDHHQLVRTSRGEEVSVLREAGTVDGSLVALQSEQQATLAQVPDLERGILGGGKQIVSGLMRRKKG